MNIFAFRPFKGKFNLGDSADIPENEDGTLIGAVKEVKSALTERGKMTRLASIGSVGNITVSDISQFTYLELFLDINTDGSRLTMGTPISVDFFKSNPNDSFGILYWNDQTGVGWSGCDIKYVNDTTISVISASGLWAFALYGIK